MTQNVDICSVLSEFLAEEEPSILFAGAGVSAHTGLPVWNN
jgi:NAD-dependent SIR2 family protein deacetylase